MENPRPRTRTLWILAVALAVTGVLLLRPWHGDHPASDDPPQSTDPEADGGIVAVPPARPEIRVGTPLPQPTMPPDPTPARPSSGPEPWRAAATGYADAFTAQAADHAEWVAGLEPWVTRHLAEEYEHTDPSRRPRGTVDSVETVAPGDYSAHVRITYDTGLVLMARLANGPDGWRVTYVEPIAGS